mgnify:FL=1
MHQNHRIRNDRAPVRRLAAILLAGSLLALPACGRGEAETPAPSVSQAATTEPAESGTSESAVAGAASPAAESGTATPAASDAALPSAKAIPPTAEALSVFPGILRAVNLSRDDVLRLLGDGVETLENVPQAITAYTWSDKDLALEYDNLTGRLNVIRTGGRTFFLDSADYRNDDIDGDGEMEGLCAYEAFNAESTDPLNRRQGYVVLIDEATGTAIAESYEQPFGGYARLSVLPQYGKAGECLVVLDTQADWECDVLRFANGQLVSMLPKETVPIEEQAKVSNPVADKGTVHLAIASAGVSFDCLLPQRILEALSDGQTYRWRFVVNRKPVIAEDGLTMRVRNSLQVMLGEARSLLAEPVGRYVDIGQVTQEYRYIGEGQWTLLTTAGGPKYAEPGQGASLTATDMAVGSNWLFSALYDVEETFGLKASDYTDFDLLAGIRFLSDGVRYGVVNSRIAEIELAGDCTAKTPRGLAAGDSRGEAMSLYGLPDDGYFEDRIWTYWFYREPDGANDRILSLDRFTLEFDGDRIERIRMEGYVPID